MTTDRQGLCQLAEQHGWQRKERDRVDIFQRGLSQIHVTWRGSTAISGGSRFDDYILDSYSRDVAAVEKWLAK